MLTVRTSVPHCFDQGEAADTRRWSRSWRYGRRYV